MKISELKVTSEGGVSKFESLKGDLLFD